MSSLKLFGTELKSLKNKKGTLIALIGVMLIPIVYCAVLLSSTWGPYDNLSNLPVAVVNNDAGAVSDGNPINVGNDLIENLKSSNTLGWDFVTDEEAKAGLEENKYYMVVEIPEDFSQKVTTVLTANPTEPELKYIQNEGLNFMGSQVTNSAVERLREQLGDKITATYATTLLSKFGDVGTGFGKAADGSNQIYDGTVTLSDGTNTLLSSLTEKAPDIAKLANGAVTADQGASKLLSSIQGGTGSVNKLADGSAQVANGAGSLVSGANQLATGSQTAKAGSASLAAGIEGKILPGAQQIAGGLNQIQSNASALPGGSKQVADGLNSIQANGSALTGGAKQISDGLNSIQANGAALTGGAKQISDGLNSIQANGAALTGGAKQISDGLNSIQANGPTLTGGAQQIADGSANVVNALQGKINPGAKDVAAGIKQLGDAIPGLSLSPEFQRLLAGANQLADGIDDLTTQAAPLKDGAAALNAGVKDVVAGVNQLAPGAEALNTGVQTVVGGVNQLAPGAEALNTGVQTVVGGVNQLAPGAEALNTGVQTVVGGVNQLAPGAVAVSNGVQSVMGGVNQLAPGSNQLVQGIRGELLPGAKVLNAGVSQIAAGNKDLAAGAKTLQNGASQVANGNKQLTQSWVALTNGAAALKNGLGQISDGTATVNTGWGTLTEGATALNEGANKLKDGSQTLATSLEDGAEQVNGLSVTDKNIAMFATPVKTVGDKVNSYTYYRDSTAPYILSLALFVGMLVLSFFVDFKKPAILPGSAISWFLSKWLQLALFATIQAVLVTLFTLFLLGLDVVNPGLFILFGIFVSLTFMSIIFFLVTAGGNIGRFLALVFIVLQLSITGSNLPIPMLPENLRSLSEYLPLTYSNAGFKSVISLGDTSLLASNAGILAIWLGVTTVLALLTFVLSYRTLRTSDSKLSEA